MERRPPRRGEETPSGRRVDPVRLSLMSVGRLKVGPERELAERYFERARAAGKPFGLSVEAAREITESRAREAHVRQAEEGRAIAAILPAGARLVALDERGKSITSEAFAADIARARDGGAAIYAIVIGGPDGLDPALRERAFTVAFGAMTWPHQLVRIMAAEQIYRAMTILAGHPYHRA